MDRGLRRATSGWLLRLGLAACALRRGRGLYDPVHHIESARIYGNIDYYAYYYVDLLIGTPPQRVSVIVDTGSGITAFPCRSCRHCGHHIDPNFDFDQSSSGNWINCGVKECTGTCREGHCGYHQGYTEGSSISGWYFQDMVRLGDSIQRNPPVRTQMGCHQDENRLFYTQKANGIMGIRPPGKTQRTILDDLFADKEHIDSRVFSLCLSEWGGRLVVGGYNKSYHTGKIQYVPLGARGYYNIPLTSMELEGRTLATRFGTAMIDSGTTYTYMATEPYRSLRRAIEEYCSQHNKCGGSQQSSRSECWEMPNGVGGFPKVDVMFHDIKMVWVPEAYMYRRGNSHRYCYGFQDDGARANTVLGASWMMYLEVIFDLRDTPRVGLAPARCPEFRRRPEHDAGKVLAPPTPQEYAVLTAAAFGAQAAPPALPAAQTEDAEGPTVPEASTGSKGPNLLLGLGLLGFSGIGLSSVVACVRGRAAAVAPVPGLELEGGGGPPARSLGAAGADEDSDGLPHRLSQDELGSGEEDPLVAAVTG